ncbi:DUF362 domain-containing protein [Candidatus Woesearchaeota archaeon]|nr:DUF362 domain-containing protein [Candidatus Woesearchaeota archaeon]
MIIRWVCEKCNKKWIYPIEKCVYCKGDIKKQKGTKIKVVGITKVFIPSPMHPVVPYNILLLQDEFGNRLPRKTMKEHKIGDVYTEQKAKTKDAVCVVKVKYDVYEAIKEAIEILNGMELNPDDKVLVKPSIIAAAYPYQAVNTNPDFLNALLMVLFELGIKKENVIVAEQALIGSDATDAASKAGILEICKKHDVEFADISKGSFEEIESDGYKFMVYKEALSRKIINAPIMKTNFQLGISGAVENLSRLVDEKTQREMYFDGVENTLPKLLKAIPNVITIADATNGIQGQGPLALGEPAFLNLILSSRNGALLDTVFCEITMLQIPLYVKSGSLGMKSIEVVGNDIDSLKYPVKASVPNETPHPDIKVIDGKACPACLNLMYYLTSKLVGLRGQEINLVIGSVIAENVIESMAKIGENLDEIEQLVLLKKLLTTEGMPRITPIDKVKSKMRKLLSKVIS